MVLHFSLIIGWGFLWGAMLGFVLRIFPILLILSRARRAMVQGRKATREEVVSIFELQHITDSLQPWNIFLYFAPFCFFVAVAGMLLESLISPFL